MAVSPVLRLAVGAADRSLGGAPYGGVVVGVVGGALVLLFLGLLGLYLTRRGRSRS